MNNQIDIENIMKLLKNAKMEREVLGKIIYPILEKHELEKKEILEVCQIGKFVQIIGDETLIIEKSKPPNPDFILGYNSNLIGLEHTQILTNDASRYFKIKNLLDYAEKEFEKKYPNITVHAQISILNDELNYGQSEKSAKAKKIAEMVRSKQIEIDCELPKYITNIITRKHSQVTFSYKEKNWQAKYLTKIRLKEEVLKKEKKLLGYKTGETKLSEFWLVLMIGSLSSVSYEFDEAVDYNIESEFDRVYLMDDFGSKVIRVS